SAQQNSVSAAEVRQKFVKYIIISILAMGGFISKKGAGADKSLIDVLRKSILPLYSNPLS
ncbi:MAG: hypothetical protein P4M11_06655, partial [Candidatus Pacebacteria bacterium]|nr:hypothetical protein [Candidatus Paceibacterota bacterium]